MTTIDNLLTATSGNIIRTWLDVNDVGRVKLPAIAITGKRPGPRLVVIAAQHGDEGFGVLGALRSTHLINPDDLSGQIVIFPCTNIDGYAHRKHESPFDMQNMNRIHPGRKDGTTSEQISDLLCTQVFPHCDLLVDLHGGSPDLGNIPLARWNDVPEKQSVQDLAESYGIDYIMPHNPSGGVMGMLNKYLGTINVPSISIETGSALDRSEDMGQEMAGYVVHTAKYMNMLPGFSPIRSDIKHVTMVGHKASVFGAYESYVKLGDEVCKGQLLGCVYSLTGERAQEIKAVDDGTVAVLRTGVVAHPWDSLIWLVIPV